MHLFHKYLLDKIYITSNKREKTANIKFYDVSGLQTGRQTVNQGDIFCFGDEEQNEVIISGDEILRFFFLGGGGLNLDKMNWKKNIG